MSAEMQIWPFSYLCLAAGPPGLFPAWSFTLIHFLVGNDVKFTQEWNCIPHRYTVLIKSIISTSSPKKIPDARILLEFTSLIHRTITKLFLPQWEMLTAGSLKFLRCQLIRKSTSSTSPCRTRMQQCSQMIWNNSWILLLSFLFLVVFWVWVLFFFLYFFFSSVRK